MLVNSILPEAVDNSAHYFVTDFVAARQMPTPFTNLFETDEFEALTDGFTPHELLDLAARIPANDSGAPEIDDALERILASRNSGF